MDEKVDGHFDQCKGWAASEAIEAGDGKWKKVCDCQ